MKVTRKKSMKRNTYFLDESTWSGSKYFTFPTIYRIAFHSSRYDNKIGKA